MNDFQWINPPRQWSNDTDRMHAVTDPATDFWRDTWYGFTRFSGHFYGTQVEGDFTFQTRIQADFQTLYDQAGIMLLNDESHWLKAGIEYNDGQPAIGSVLTQEYSDWATGLFAGDPREFWMLLTRRVESLLLQYSSNDVKWTWLRLCHMALSPICRVGVMCCTPEREGLAVQFSAISLTPPLNKALHDLS